MSEIVNVKKIDTGQYTVGTKSHGAFKAIVVGDEVYIGGLSPVLKLAGYAPNHYHKYSGDRITRNILCLGRKMPCQFVSIFNAKRFVSGGEKLSINERRERLRLLDEIEDYFEGTEIDSDFWKIKKSLFTPAKGEAYFVPFIEDALPGAVRMVNEFDEYDQSYHRAGLCCQSADEAERLAQIMLNAVKDYRKEEAGA